MTCIGCLQYGRRYRCDAERQHYSRRHRSQLSLEASSQLRRLQALVGLDWSIEEGWSTMRYHYAWRHRLDGVRGCLIHSTCLGPRNSGRLLVSLSWTLKHCEVAHTFRKVSPSLMLVMSYYAESAVGTLIRVLSNVRLARRGSLFSDHSHSALDP